MKVSQTTNLCFYIKKTRTHATLKTPAHVFHWSHLLLKFLSHSLILLTLSVLPRASLPIPQHLVLFPSSTPSLPSQMDSYRISTHALPSVTLSHIPLFFLSLCRSSLRANSLLSVTCEAFSVRNLSRKQKLCKSYLSSPLISEG